MIELMKQKATFHQSEIQDGDIVCFQTELSEQCVLILVGAVVDLSNRYSYRQLDLDRTTKHLTPVQMYDFFVNRVVVTFKPRYEDNQIKHPDFELTLNKKMNYEAVSTVFGISQRLPQAHLYCCSSRNE